MDYSYDFAKIKANYPEKIGLEQMRVICHISKKTARYLLTSGLVPCIDTGKKTRQYIINTKDVITYLKKRQSQLYQKANIQITGFEKADLPDSFFDVVIGNVPFGDYSVADPQYNRLHFKIHDYFFAKSIDKLRTGGIIACVTTSGTLDKKSEEVRRYINARCDFIGAVRLPDSTFKSAGTKAMADIIFLQKRDRILEQDASWLHTTQTEDGLSLNSYFAEHPEMVCGTLKTVSGPYGPTLTCEAFADKPLANVLKEAMPSVRVTSRYLWCF